MVRWSGMRAKRSDEGSGRMPFEGVRRDSRYEMVRLGEK